MGVIKDLTGRIYGRLTVIRMESRGTPHPRWECLCTCGNTTVTVGPNLKNGHTKSCGCLKKETDKTSSLKHGLTINRKIPPLYRKWASVKERCTNPNYRYWDRYGGRGITMCAEWIDSPEAFIEYMGPQPFPKAEIDRIDNNGNYEPGNVRWASHKENCRNTSINKRYEYDGLWKTPKEWAEEWNVPYESIRSRMRRGWSKNDMLNIPKFKVGGKRCTREEEALQT